MKKTKSFSAVLRTIPLVSALSRFSDASIADTAGEILFPWGFSQFSVERPLASVFSPTNEPSQPTSFLGNGKKTSWLCHNQCQVFRLFYSSFEGLHEKHQKTKLFFGILRNFHPFANLRTCLKRLLTVFNFFKVMGGGQKMLPAAAVVWSPVILGMPNILGCCWFWSR